MEELQGWWEVPTIAHFCHVFQAAFNLFHYEIEELESALLQNDNPYCATVEQLAMRLVKGCYRRTAMTPENWEELLHKLLDKKVPKEKEIEHLGDFSQPFDTLPVQNKVQILLKLCELRLDLEEVPEAIKNLESRDLRIEPIGTDSEKNVYFYFFGVRLYKENLKKQRNVMLKAVVQTPKVQSQKQSTKSSRRCNTRSSRKRNVKSESPTPPVMSSSWSIVCHNLEDWEALIRKLKKSKSNMDLVHTLEEKYLPIILELIVKREQIERKKLLEFIPRRTSSRIEKVRQQQESKQAAAEAVRLQKLEEERQKQAFEDKNRKKRETEDRAKRLEERHLAMEERAERAKLRELRSQYSDSSDIEESSGFSTPSRSRSPIFRNGYCEDNHSRDSDVDYGDSQGSDMNSERGSDSSAQDSGENSDNDGSDDNDENIEENNVDSDDEKSNSESGEDSEDDDDSSDQTNSLKENEICDTNVNLEIRTVVFPRDKDHVQYQNAQPYASRNLQQVNGACVEPHTARKTMKTYSRLDQQLFIKNNTKIVRPEIPVPKIITFNFRSNIPQNAALTHPIKFHTSTN